MSVPDFQSLMLPVLKALADGSERELHTKVTGLSILLRCIPFRHGLAPLAAVAA